MTEEKKSKDITRTTTLRKQTVRSGLHILRNIQTEIETEFRFSYDNTQQHKTFLEFVSDRLNSPDFVGSTDDIVEGWLQKSTEKSFVKGIARSQTTLGVQAVLGVDISLLPSTVLERANLLYNRQFYLLKNISQELSKNIALTLSEGVLNGDGVEVVAKKLEDLFGLTEKRATLIARTEIINANAEGFLLETEKWQDYFGKTLRVIWIHSGLPNGRKNHIEMNLKEMSIEEARKEKGKPNCRCTITQKPIYKQYDDIKTKSGGNFENLQVKQLELTTF